MLYNLILSFLCFKGLFKLCFQALMHVVEHFVGRVKAYEALTRIPDTTLITICENNKIIHVYMSSVVLVLDTDTCRASYTPLIKSMGATKVKTTLVCLAKFCRCSFIVNYSCSSIDGVVLECCRTATLFCSLVLIWCEKSLVLALYHGSHVFVLTEPFPCVLFTCCSVVVSFNFITIFDEKSL